MMIIGNEKRSFLRTDDRCRGRQEKEEKRWTRGQKPHHFFDQFLGSGVGIARVL